MANDARETRLRRMAQRRGLQLVKNRRRDPGAIGYGRFCLRDKWDTGRVVGVVRGAGFTLVDAPAGRGGAERFGAWLTLDVVERVLEAWGLPASAGASPAVSASAPRQAQVPLQARL